MLGVDAGMRAGAASLFVLGDYWQPDRAVRSHIGQLVYQAKDCADTRAASELAERFAQLAEVLPGARALRDKRVVSADHCEELDRVGLAWIFVAVPSSSDRPGFQLSAVLAQALAEASKGCYLPGAVIRTREGPRIRTLPPLLRTAAAAGAGYEVRVPVVGRSVVLVDDVILTGATVGEITARLQDAGASGVIAAVAARARRSSWS